MDASVAEALATAFARALEHEGPIATRLAIYAEALRVNFAEYDDCLEQVVARLKQVKAGESSPKAGEVLPPFLLPDQHGRLVTLEEIVATGPAAIVFLRGHWCPFCRIYASALAKAHHRVRAHGGQIAAITPELQACTQQQINEAKADFPILSDVGNGYALSLNLAIWIGTEMQRILSAIGRDLSAFHGNDNWMLPIPATFIVNRQGIVVERFFDPDYRTRMDVDDLVAAIARADLPGPEEVICVR